MYECSLSLPFPTAVAGIAISILRQLIQTSYLVLETNFHAITCTPRTWNYTLTMITVTRFDQLVYWLICHISVSFLSKYLHWQLPGMDFISRVVLIVTEYNNKDDVFHTFCKASVYWQYSQDWISPNWHMMLTSTNVNSKMYCIACTCVSINVMLCCVVLRCIVLRCAVTLRCVVLCCALRCVALRCVALRCVALRYVMLCYVMLCYVMLCYVMLWYVMLCYVMFVGLRPVIQILCHVLARGWGRWLRYFTEAKAEVKYRASARIRGPKHDTGFEWPVSILLSVVAKSTWIIF